MIDPKARKILFTQHWNAWGWRNDERLNISPEDLAYAKAKDMMFDPVDMDHDALVAALITERDKIDPLTVGRAFLASLSSRRLDLRSALGSYAVARDFPDHRFDPAASALLPTGNRLCGHCEYCVLKTPEPINLNVLNFQRFKFGGLRFDQLEYMWFDLWRFNQTEQINPTEEDHALMRAILDTIAQVPPDRRLTVARKTLTGVFKSNSSERRVLCDILAIAGLLQPKDQPSYLDGFVRLEDREHSGLHFDDYSYPAGLWHGRDGINPDALAFWFPDLDWAP
jgi:hypothetical protein